MGIKPSEFYEMTLKDIGEYCESVQKHEMENYKVISTIVYRCTDKLIAGVNLKKPKNLKYEELFPEFHNGITEADKEENIANKWRVFLKG